MKSLTLLVLIFIVAVYCEGVKQLEPYAQFDSKMIDESSGFVKSRNFENLYWTHNDSGDDPRIFAVNVDGELHIPEWKKRKKYKGFTISDAVNIDWEDISTDNKGNLYIGACGNNGNARKDLAIYVIKEPNPFAADKSRYFKRIDFFYPEQKEFPPMANNFDCEAIFNRDGNLYLLTKHRADLNTVLYKLDLESKVSPQPAQKIAEFNIKGNVTAADCSIDGSRVAVLTYNNVWVFEGSDENIFNGKIYHLPISGKQCEAITFEDDKTLIITNEQKDLYRLSISDMEEL